MIVAAPRPQVACATAMEREYTPARRNTITRYYTGRAGRPRAGARGRENAAPRQGTVATGARTMADQPYRFRYEVLARRNPLPGARVRLGEAGVRPG